MKKRKKKKKRSNFSHATIRTYFKRNKRRKTYKGLLGNTIMDNIYGQDGGILRNIRKSNECFNALQVQKPLGCSLLTRKYGATINMTCQRNLIQYFGRKYFDRFTRQVFHPNINEYPIQGKLVSLDHHPRHNLVCSATNRQEINIFNENALRYVIQTKKRISKAKFSVDGNDLVVSFFSKKLIDLIDFRAEKIKQSFSTNQCNLDFMILDQNSMIIVGDKIRILDQRAPQQPTPVTENKESKKSRFQNIRKSAKRFGGLGFGSSRRTIKTNRKKKKEGGISQLKTIPSNSSSTPPRCISAISHVDKSYFVVGGHDANVMLYDIRNFQSSSHLTSITKRGSSSSVKKYPMNTLFIDCLDSLRGHITHSELIDRKKVRTKGEFWNHQIKSEFFVDRLVQHPTSSSLVCATTSNGYTGLLDLTRGKIIKLVKQKELDEKYTGPITPAFFQDEFSGLNHHHHTFLLLPCYKSVKVLDWSLLGTPEVYFREQYNKVLSTESQYDVYGKSTMATMVARSGSKGNSKGMMKVTTLFCSGDEISCALSVPSRGGVVLCGGTAGRVHRFRFQEFSNEK